jgi:hypothetical protein
MHTLLTVLVTWLSVNYGLSERYEHPRIEFASPGRMAEVRYSRLGSLRQDRVAAEASRLAPPEVGHDVYAIYDDASRTIYLREGWTGRTSAEISVLVHELVHHVQNLAGQRFFCAAEREKPAYRAQADWLALFGKNLEGEFGIDAMTLLVRTNCIIH